MWGDSGPSGPAWRELPHLHIRAEFMNYAATSARPEESAAAWKAYLSSCLIDLFFLSCFFKLEQLQRGRENSAGSRGAAVGH